MEISDEQIRRIYEDRQRGESFYSLEKKYGLDRGTIHRILEGYQAGLQSTPNHTLDYILVFLLGFLVGEILVLITLKL